MKVRQDILFDDCGSLQNSLLNVLPKNEMDELAANMTVYQYAPGEEIFHQGQPANGFYCIQHGLVKEYGLGRHSKPHIVHLCSAGDALGYRAILTDMTYSFSTMAIKESIICFFPKKIFLDILTKDRPFSYALMKRLCDEVKDAENNMMRLAQNTVRENSAALLLMLEKKFGIKNDGNINVKIRREELANIIGTSTETFVRTLSELQNEQLIRTRGKKIQLINKSALRRISKTDQ